MLRRLLLAYAAILLLQAPAFSGAAPPVPVPARPDTTIPTVSPMYLWSPSPTATSYSLRVLDSMGALYDSADLSLAAASCPTNFGACGVVLGRPLENLSSYSWQLSASNSGGTSDFSTPMFFSTNSASVPSPPAAVYPSGNVGTTRPMFLWSPSPGATAYKLRVRPQATPQVAVLDVLLNFAQASCPANTGACGYGLAQFTPDTPYTWEVAAVNANGTSAFSSMMFTVVFSQPLPPPTPVPGAPDGATSTATPMFLWSPSPRATGYVLTLRTSLGGPDVWRIPLTLHDAMCPTNSGACGYVAPMPLPDGVPLYWSVSATIAEVSSPPSAPRAFSTPFSTSSCASLPFPLPPALGNPQGPQATDTPMFLWTPSPGTTAYTLRLTTGAGSHVFSIPLSLDDALCPGNVGACGTLPPSPLACQSYSWEVAAYGCGWGEYSPPASFTIPSCVFP